MKIHFKPNHSRVNLLLGVAWILLGTISIIFENESRWLDSFWLVLGIVYLILYYYQKKDKFLSIDETEIKEHWIFGKRIPRSEITQVKFFAGEHIFESPKRKITVPINSISEDSKSDFLTEIDKLRAEIN